SCFQTSVLPFLPLPVRDDGRLQALQPAPAHFPAAQTVAQSAAAPARQIQNPAESRVLPVPHVVVPLRAVRVLPSQWWCAPARFAGRIWQGTRPGAPWIRLKTPMDPANTLWMLSAAAASLSLPAAAESRTMAATAGIWRWILRAVGSARADVAQILV